jgi:hypothetical protein
MMDFNWLQGLLAQNQMLNTPADLTLQGGLLGGAVPQFPTQADAMPRGEMVNLPAFDMQGTTTLPTPAPNLNPNWATSAEVELGGSDQMQAISDALMNAQGLLPLDVAQLPPAPGASVSRGSPLEEYLWKSLVLPSTR